MGMKVFRDGLVAKPPVRNCCSTNGCRDADRVHGDTYPRVHDPYTRGLTKKKKLFEFGQLACLMPRSAVARRFARQRVAFQR